MRDALEVHPRYIQLTAPNNFMANLATNKKPSAATKKKTAKQPEKQLSPKTKEFLAKLQKIQDNVLRDINDLES